MTKSGLNYFSQDRGNENQYAKYLSGMDSVIVEKIASASAFIPHKAGYSIIDVGMASGTGTYILAALFPKCKVIGVDINPKMVEIANDTYQLPNLKYIVDDGEKLRSLSNEKIIGFFNCSSIHHITSFNNYNVEKAYLTLKRQSELLSDGGVIVVRDFLKPEPVEVIVKFSEDNEGAKNCELLERFSKTARSLSRENEQGFPIKRISQNKYQLHYSDALEFIRRKDYIDDWEVELQEEYGYYSQANFEELFQNLGLRIIMSGPIFNPWIIKNRYRNKFKLFDLNNNHLGDPPTNYVIAGEKLKNKGVRLKEGRYLPVPDNSFIQLKSYKNSENGMVFDVAHRPSPVLDLLPYYFNNKCELKVLAKSGYPRPIINQLHFNQIIDKKQFSGYMTETIAIAKTDEHLTYFIPKVLNERFAVSLQSIGQINKSLEYYTSPGGIDETVSSFTIKLDLADEFETQSINANYIDFKDAGEIRSYDAMQLLKSIQVGAVLDVRLEILLYDLLWYSHIRFDKWLNDQIEIEKANKLKVVDLNDIVASSNIKYEEVNESACFLSHNRVKFFEQRNPDSTSILEYIVPEKLSPNTVVTLPVFEYLGEVYVGIEERYLPVPQMHEGNSFLLAVPAFRLPKTVTNSYDLEQFILNLEFGNSKVVRTNKLGEKYLPSLGITPEQVYPYVVTIDKPTEELHWVALKDLIRNVKKLKDGHLIVCLYRLMHALRMERENL